MRIVRFHTPQIFRFSAFFNIKYVCESRKIVSTRSCHLWIVLTNEGVWILHNVIYTNRTPMVIWKVGLKCEYLIIKEYSVFWPVQGVTIFNHKSLLFLNPIDRNSFNLSIWLDVLFPDSLQFFTFTSHSQG